MNKQDNLIHAEQINTRKPLISGICETRATQRHSATGVTFGRHFRGQQANFSNIYHTTK